MAPVLKIDYLELGTGALEASRMFFADAFGWTFTAYGGSYLAFENAGMDGGLDGKGPVANGVLVVIKADNLEEAQARVEKAGGKIVQDIFSFPGGRRFHFVEPGGNEMAVWSD